MTNQVDIVEFNVTTGETIERAFTPEEKAANDAARASILEAKAEAEAEEAARIAAKESAEAKLAALGLTPEEIAALR